MNIINAEYAEVFYTYLSELKNSNSDELRVKIKRSGRILNEILDTIIESEIQSFQGLLPKVLFVIDKYNVDSNLAWHIRDIYLYVNRIRRNKSIIPSGKQFNYVIIWISEFVKYFSSVIWNEDITVFDTVEYLIEEEKNQNISINNCLVFTKQSAKKVKLNGLECLEFLCVQNDNNKELTIRIIKENYSTDEYFEYLLKVPEFTKIRFIKLEKAASEEIYYCRLNSTFIIEPDYLIDVSDISACFTFRGNNYKIYFLDKFFTSEQSEGTIRGSLVNSLLDLRLKNPNYDYEELFKLAIEQNLLKLSTINKTLLDKIHDDISSRHFPQIVKFTDALLNIKEKNDVNITIEPTFYSEIYGIQGRLDLLVEFSEEPLKKEIVELKSGSPPNYGAWKNDLMQAVGYDLMLQSVFGKDRRGSNNIFYSASYDNMYRNVVRSESLESEFCRVRNLIVLEIIKQANGDYYFYENFSVEKFGEYPVYLKDKIQYFYKVISNLDEEEFCYFKLLCRFVWNELLAVKLGVRQELNQSKYGFSSLWNETYEDKIESFSILGELKFASKSENGDFVFSYNGTATNFRANDIGVIYKVEADSENPLRQQIYKCNVKEIANNYVIVSLRNEQLNNILFNAEETYAIEHDMFDSNYFSSLKSIFSFFSSSKEIRNKILGKTFPNDISINNDDLIYIDKYINKADSANNYFLLQGPPGTGKTSTFLIKYLHKILDNKNNTVLILTFTNRALEEIVKHLLNNEDDFILFSNTNNQEYSFKTKLKNEFYNDEKIIIPQICLATVSSYLLYQNEIHKHFNLNQLIVDEASQILESQLLGIVANFSKFVLVGDQNQLPAITVQDPKYCVVNNDKLNSLGINDLSNSLFDRLFNRLQTKGINNNYDTLTIHYRMHNQIAGLINHYYQNKLECGTDKQKDKEPIGLLAESKFDKRVFFFDIREDRSYSKFSLKEAEFIKQLLIKAASQKENITEETFGIITPWRAQISMLNNTLSDLPFFSKIMIDTVERFQGSEKENIFVSFAVTNKLQLKSLSNVNITNDIDRKLNVTISRAKEHLYLIGNSNLLSQLTHYKQVLAKVLEIES